MHILAFIRGVEVPSSRYRVLQYREPLARRGHVLDVREFPEDAAGWLAAAEGVTPGTVVLLQKRRVAPRHIRALQTRGARVVYDVDDAVMLRTDGTGSFLRRWRFRRTVRACDGVLAGNAFLRDEAAAGGARRVLLLPTVLDISKYAARAPSAGNDPLVIGWIGGPAALPFLRDRLPVFAALTRNRGTRIVVRIVSSEGLSHPEVPTEFRRWSEATEAAEVAAFDIGVSPLPDTPWARGKCATKLLQCMAAGVPVVADAVGAHNEIVRNGENGLLARTDAEWLDRLEGLRSDPALRARLGAAGRRTVETGYALEGAADKMAAFLAEVSGF